MEALKLSGKMVDPYSLKNVLCRRDGLTAEEAEAAIAEAQERVAQGEDPEDVLADEFGLEPDYVWELLD